MKRKNGLIIILALTLILALNSTVFAADYSDTSGHWARTEINKWSNAGILQGCDGKFRPSDSITRGEMAIIIDRIMDYQVTVNNSFADFPGDAYFTDSILKANAAGVILGDAGRARPNDYITREEVAVMLGRAFGVEASGVGSLHFTDKNNIASWASSMVLAMESRGFVNGTDNKFLPKNNISRAEVVKIIDNIVRRFINKAGTYNDNVVGSLVVNVPGVTLKDMTVSGDLIIAAGVGQGEITMDNVKVNGNLIVKGGGINSININGASRIGKVILSKVGSEIRLITGDDAEVQQVIVNDGSDDVILTGFFDDVRIVAPAVTVNTINADITSFTAEGKGSGIVLEGQSTVGTLILAGQAVTARGDNGSVITMLTADSTADNAEVSGAMIVLEAQINADNVSIDTMGTEVTVSEGISGTNSNGTAMAAGKTIITSALMSASAGGSSRASAPCARR